jgi:GH15 family glucan-1,4-alpha-glucosidase
MADFTPIRPIDGYFPIEDHGLIGDLATSALVGKDGAISWMCVPRFDSPPLFCGILDKARGGAFRLEPEGLRDSRQTYLEDTGVLVTELRGSDGVVQVTDALTLQDGADLAEGLDVARHELVRAVRVLEGRVRLRVEVTPRDPVDVVRRSGGYKLELADRPELELHLSATRPLEGLRTTFELDQGDELHLFLRWGSASVRFQSHRPDEVLAATVAAWRRWLECFRYEGPQAKLVRRSALAIKMLDYAPTGAIVAAPTSSLPEAIGGVRNWDYRFAWIRDAAFSVYALRRIGIASEAWAFLAWVLDAVERHGAPKILYTLDGESPEPEWEDPELEGYRKSPPVRWNNGAADQTQHDVYGEILDCAFQWARPGGELDAHLWERLRMLVEAAREKWRTPDHGIWEVRTPGRLFTYSVALCQVALDRGARLAEQFGLPGDVEGWRQEAERIRQAILEEAWDEERQSLTEHLGGGGLDASLLALPLRRVIPADHPKMIATTQAVMERLGAGDGLIYRYLPDESPDGLPGHEGAFLLCSFWYCDNIARQGRLEEALALYDSLCARANHVGLLPEQIDPESGIFLGNFPQAFSHIGVISSGINLSRLMKAKDA